MAANFSPSQISYTDGTSPITFRISPFKLLWSDLNLIPRSLLILPNTLLPLETQNPRAELNIGVSGNVISILLQIVAGVISLIGLLALPVVIFLPISVSGFGVYCVIIAALCAPGKNR